MSDSNTDLIAPGEGENTADVLIKLRADAFSLMEAHVQPNQLLMPHTHDVESQAVFTIETGGEDGVVFAAPAGSYVRKPGGVCHGFWNKGEEAARYIELSAGATFEGLVDDAAEAPLQASLTAPIKHGVTFHFERVPGLLETYGLTSVRGAELSGPMGQKIVALVEKFTG